jgi:hypothetical protein
MRCNVILPQCEPRTETAYYALITGVSDRHIDNAISRGGGSDAGMRNEQGRSREQLMPMIADELP